MQIFFLAFFYNFHNFALENLSLWTILSEFLDKIQGFCLHSFLSPMVCNCSVVFCGRDFSFSTELPLSFDKVNWLESVWGLSVLSHLSMCLTASPLPRSLHYCGFRVSVQIQMCEVFNFVLLQSYFIHSGFRNSLSISLPGI